MFWSQNLQHQRRALEPLSHGDPNLFSASGERLNHSAMATRISSAPAASAWTTWPWRPESLQRRALEPLGHGDPNLFSASGEHSNHSAMATWISSEAGKVKALRKASDTPSQLHHCLIQISTWSILAMGVGRPSPLSPFVCLISDRADSAYYSFRHTDLCWLKILTRMKCHFFSLFYGLFGLLLTYGSTAGLDTSISRVTS